MKRLWVSFFVPLFLLCGCQTEVTSSSSSDTSIADSDVSTVSDSTSASSSSSLTSDSASSSSDSSSEEENSSSSVDDGPKTVDLYAINDFHGAVKTDYGDPGILKLGTYLKNTRKQENTLLINSGDMFQGSLESNYSHGAFLTDCMNDIHFDAFTLGNHEFDWGDTYITQNKARKDATTGYSTPFLAANVYKYDIDTKTVGDYADLGEKYTISTLANGLKVGIIGEIGSDQITSICSNYVDDYTFVDPVETAKTLSDELRTQKGCDIVVLSIHAPQSAVLNTGLTSVSSVSSKRYVDAVFCAHSHQKEDAIENGVPFIQGGSYGKYISHVKLSYTSSETNMEVYENITSSYLSVESIDSSLQSIYDKYTEETDTLGNTKIATLDENLYRYGTDNNCLMNLSTEAFGWALNQHGNSFSSVDYSLSNLSRATLYSGNVTYSKLFSSLPFDNIVYIGTVKGSEILEGIQDNGFLFTRYDEAALEDDKTYTVAVIDYVGLHRNSNREYDYFPSLTIKGHLTKNGEIWNYRDITREYMEKLGTITASDYSSSLPAHNPDSLTSSITL